VRFGLFVPPFHDFAEPRRVAALARRAEDAGWDGLYIWDHILGANGVPVADPWITMAAISTSTTYLRFGALVTPLPRRRPWVLARQIATLDRLSDGRLTVGVGIGDDGWSELSAFGEIVDPAVRGEVLDEALDLLQRLLSGEPVDHNGHHFTVHTGALLPAPVQDPVPMWAACRWPNRKPLARAAKLDGCFPIFADDGPPKPPDPADIVAIRVALLDLGARPGIDLVVRCALSLEDPARVTDTVAALEEAGVTWILEGFGPGEPPPDIVERIVDNGPPILWGHV
jgi:alkanesulfonate monooxygenase SsuD/methylene tetrahydromethanopterin reductase-like flavin-dependent oxidoreductase (luciferase family)